MNHFGQHQLMDLPSTKDLQIFYMEAVWPTIRRLGRFLTHPVSLFVLLQSVCIAVTVLWVVWFVNQNEALVELSRSFGEKNIDTSFGLGLLIAGCILLGVLIVGLIVLFTNAQRISRMNRQQQNFVSSVTHELRSPLASLQLAFETIRGRALEEGNRRQLFHIVERDLDRLKRLVDQILLSAKLDRGMIELAKTDEVVLREVVADAVSRASHLDSQIAARVKINCDPELKINSTKDGLALILGNFLENAIKYSPRGTPIDIAVTRDQKFWQIAVSDQGFGLLPRDRKRVFRMFHRSDIATKRAIPGTGLGLYIVQTIAKSMGGKVWAESPGKDQGSTFFLRILDRKPNLVGLSQ